MISLDRVFKYYQSHGTTKIILDHVSMNFREGSSYAVMGINGAGKSTLMRLLAGTELPNAGHVHRRSRISWPLGFGGGLHPKLTGRENVQFVARIYGQDVRRTIRFVEDFAELGAYMDVPLSTYSSGMAQRLAFGLSMAVEFECYLIDEVLAVGDARFQQRCHEEFSRRRSRSDIIMISHSIPMLKEYCSRGVVLANGILHIFTNVDDAVELYKQLNA
jgi:capsular polysaccharide transport system ATP-binding protein